ncbi:MAG: UDP-N-acetylmuramoyl-L-alanyl-D-glutamate--2,6-diaminopimelate ligase [Bacteroidetes bacterium]|uniref:UDP-N-acetylmuramoyl-L-alanyl-D-glutamate--2,6-diaminopimelate ligase n=1 Tax=Candidatus Gallipaludibacter merdavium TaxID=2840839 RepID=A0A9D9HU28_9BACT|nr:UDP-N-acetylmuramoyl-L-alanyl-D-glutamate--2,6-diaminopimelate ligase [Candidatus Gallipaludibacter merdavium]
MKLSHLLNGLKPIRTVGNLDIEINSVQFDSRLVRKGDLFVATPGTVVNGHDYIPKAIAQGGVAVVCEQLPKDWDSEVTYVQLHDSLEGLGIIASAFYDNPSRKLTLVGVTGTNGKTTIATLLYKLTRALGYKAGLLSTVCNYVDDVAVEATHTTPDPLELNRLLGEMVDAGCQYAFMEVSSHAVAQRRIAGLDYDGGIFTNLTRDHIDYHKTFDNYRDAKKRFFDELPPKAFALINADDKNGLVMLQNTQAKRLTYSCRTLADFNGKILEEGFEGMLLQINGKEVFVPLVGRFNVYNLLAIYGAAISLGFDRDEVLRILSSLTAVSGRFECIRSPKGWTAIVDYAHTPDALTNVINTINEIRKHESHLITVVGCGGNRDKGKRPMMAHEAAIGSTRVVLTSDNPRDEEPMDILNDMLAGLNEEERQAVLVIPDRREAIKTACALAQKDDVILIAGKGHEDYQIIKGVKHHFDDREEVRKCL